ncbi:MAG: class I SAM-dependent rRNA methyltransferase [Polyangiaceae bacterium]
MARVVLKPGHVRPVFSGHPWIFQQAIASVEGGARAGDQVDVVDPPGNLLGCGLYSPGSAIAVRLFTRSHRPIDGELFRLRIAEALERRRRAGLPSTHPARETTGYRLVHGEGDRLPGLVVDVFEDVLVVQLNTIGIKLREGMVLEALASVMKPRAIIDRTSASVKRLEGFEPGAGVIRGEASSLVFRERGFAYDIGLDLAQKTGFYFDQRALRARVESLAHGKTVLDTFSFVGSFSLAAARGGATSVTAVDESAQAVLAGAQIARANGLASKIAFVRGDAVRALGDASSTGGFDLVICDPPKLAPSRANKDAALLAYKKIARSACRATKARGILVFCSCSSAVSIDDLVRCVAIGAADARMFATILERFTQGPDHPVPAAFPEGLYLKSVIAELDPVDG